MKYGQIMNLNNYKFQIKSYHIVKMRETQHNEYFAELLSYVRFLYQFWIWVRQIVHIYGKERHAKPALSINLCDMLMPQARAPVDVILNCFV